MKERVKTETAEIRYKIRKSNRAKRLRITVCRDQSVIVTLPCGMNNLKYLAMFN